MSIKRNFSQMSIQDSRTPFRHPDGPGQEVTVSLTLIGASDTKWPKDSNTSPSIGSRRSSLFEGKNRMTLIGWITKSTFRATLPGASRTPSRFGTFDTSDQRRPTVSSPSRASRETETREG
jgi:hypothetical protein